MVEGRKLYKPLLISIFSLSRTYCICLCCSSKVKQKGTHGAKPQLGTVDMWPTHSLTVQMFSICTVCLSYPYAMKQPLLSLGDMPAREDTTLNPSQTVSTLCGQEAVRLTGKCVSELSELLLFIGSGCTGKQRAPSHPSSPITMP